VAWRRVGGRGYQVVRRWSNAKAGAHWSSGSAGSCSALRGTLRDNSDTRAEFFRLLQGMKGFRD
jgi:hypothetical protein